MNGARITRSRVGSGDRLTFGDTVVALDSGTAPPRRFTRARSTVVAGLLVAVGAAGLAYVWWSANAVSVERIAAEASESVYLLALDDAGQRTIVGTGFLIDRKGVLATNAHVADRLRAANAVAIRGDSYDVSGIRRIVVHPRWTSQSFADDVALVELARPSAAQPLRLADSSELGRLHRGLQLAAFGFPAASTDPFRPRGRVYVDVLADVQPPFLGVNLSIAPGMSGSPVFGARGEVVAIVLAGDFVRAEGGALPRPSGSAANWAISVNVLKDLIGRN